MWFHFFLSEIESSWLGNATREDKKLCLKEDDFLLNFTALEHRSVELQTFQSVCLVVTFFKPHPASKINLKTVVLCQRILRRIIEHTGVYVRELAQKRAKK